MKKLRKIFGTVVLLAMLMAGTAYAQIPTIDSLPGHYNQSVLLKNGETTSQDKIESYERRGTIFSAGMIQITNEQNGNLYISVDTAAHVKVDSIYQAVYLEKWDDKSEDWVLIGHWEFERTKEEEDNNLTSYHVGFTVSGCEVNRYYRATAIHLVQLGDDAEGKATSTNGVLLTDHAV